MARGDTTVNASPRAAEASSGGGGGGGGGPFPSPPPPPVPPPLALATARRSISREREANSATATGDEWRRDIWGGGRAWIGDCGQCWRVWAVGSGQWAVLARRWGLEGWTLCGGVTWESKSKNPVPA